MEGKLGSGVRPRAFSNVVASRFDEGVTMASSRALQVVSGVFLIGGCSSPSPTDELQVTIRIMGDEVTIDWMDPRPVHGVIVVPRLDGTPKDLVWDVNVSNGGITAPSTPPAIRAPISYGASVDGAFTVFGPAPLVEGTTYEVQVDEWGWGDECEARGVDVEMATSACSIGFGVGQFSF